MPAETLDGLTTHVGHDAAVDFLDRVEENARLHAESLTADAFATAKGLFRRHEGFSLVDACLVAYMRAEGIDYLYAFDSGFDAADGISRLDVEPNRTLAECDVFAGPTTLNRSGRVISIDHEETDQRPGRRRRRDA